jgi:hypothetical protein
MLVTSAYTPNAVTHTKRSDVANEVSGTDYTAGGATLTDTSISAGNTDDEGVFDADDVGRLDHHRGAVLYTFRGGAASEDELLMYFDFGSDQILSNGNCLLTWDVEGI